MTASLLKSPGLFSVFRLIFNNAVVWMASSRPLISKSFSPCINPLLTTKSTNYNWYYHHLHVSGGVSSLARYYYYYFTPLRVFHPIIIILLL